tara:strand:- start:3489 stop:3881 length:393 start_codon:yes stop_codon:yes gene_type:complete
VTYYFSTTLELPFDAAVDKVTAALQEQQFGVLTTIDVSETLKKKLDVDFPRYVILGACNPAMAHSALLAENKIGTMLPCNVIVRDVGDDRTEVAAVDPVSSMQAVGNKDLEDVATNVQAKLRNVIQSLGQ